jgi:uncharacterized membrane protein
MSKENKTVKTLISAILAVGIASGAASSLAEEKSEKPKAEKCYGIAKKGMNDCAGNNHSCQGQSTKDGDPGVYLYVLEGTCQKIVGGIKKD